MPFTHIRAILFDKDGTLFDFSASWSGWAEALLDDLADGAPERRARLAEAISFDLGAGRFDPASPVIAGTLEEATDLLLPHLPHMRFARLCDFLVASATRAEMVPPVPLAPLMEQFTARGFTLGVATNDAYEAAEMHLIRAGIHSQFAHVLGYDSGYTPKPAPDMLLGFASRAGLSPESVVMVGDSTHDLIAGRRAGMATIGVLTGLAPHAELAPHADAVLPDIGHLPEVLGLAL